MMSVEHVRIPEAVVAVLEQMVRSDEKQGRRRWGAGSRRKDAEHHVGAAGRLLQDGTCASVFVRHDTAPAVVTHEHGLLVFTPVDDQTTHLMEVVSVGDDARWEMHEAGQLLVREWRWLRLGEIGVHGFVASGEPVAPIDLGDFDGTGLETVLVEGDDGWPGDDAILPLSFADVCRLAGER